MQQFEQLEKHFQEEQSNLHVILARFNFHFNLLDLTVCFSNVFVFF